MISEKYKKLLAEAGYTGSTDFADLFVYSRSNSVFIKDDLTFGCAGGRAFTGYVDGKGSPEDACAEYILRTNTTSEDGDMEEGKKRPKKKAKKKYVEGVVEDYNN